MHRFSSGKINEWARATANYWDENCVHDVLKHCIITIYTVVTKKLIKPYDDYL